MPSRNVGLTLVGRNQADEIPAQECSATPETAEAAGTTVIIGGNSKGLTPGTNILYRLTSEPYRTSTGESNKLVPAHQKIIDPSRESSPLVGLPTHLTEEVVDHIWAKLCRTLRGYRSSELLYAIAVLAQADLDVPSFAEGP